MTTLLNLGRDIQGLNANSPPFTTLNYQATLVSDAATNITVPSNFKNWIAIFSFTIGQSVWMSVNHTAIVPIGGTLTLTNSQLLDSNTRRVVYGGDQISIISATTPDVCISLYAIS